MHFFILVVHDVTLTSQNAKDMKHTKQWQSQQGTTMGAECGGGGVGREKEKRRGAQREEEETEKAFGELWRTKRKNDGAHGV